MQLNGLQLTNFKNHSSVQLQFNEQIVCFVGDNGVGKTNLLDAIHYLSLTKSYFNTTDTQNILNGQNFFRLDGMFNSSGQTINICCKIPFSGKKEILSNNVPYDRLADHVGRLPVVMITPYDNDLINGSAEIRRRFLDMAIGQMDSDYLYQLMLYNKIVQQRNALLRQFAERQKTNLALLQTLNEQLIPVGNMIFEKRHKTIPQLAALTLEFYKKISADKEQVGLAYESDLQQSSFDKLLQQSQDRDLAAERTTAGIHKDDLQFSIAGQPIKKMGSQGQQKSFLLAIKFAVLAQLQQAHQVAPILLIDDLFDRLDAHRVANVVQLLPQFGQVFITHTSATQLKEILNIFNQKFQLFEIN